MRPLAEVLDTVMVDRGGAPLHFVLTHAVFWVETSADALRWLSVACALAAIPLCFDLARRLAGLGAGIVASAVAASSTALAVYGSFGRMNALYVLVAALAADLFVRALQLRTRRAVMVAAAAAWLLPAVHPYGLIPAVAELAVAVVLWRRRSVRSALPVAGIALAAVPFVVADLRLADRARLGAGGESLASPGDAWGELVAALSAFAGGDGYPLVWLSFLGFVGMGVLARRLPAFAVVAGTVALPPVLFLLLRAGSAPDLSPRHLFYGLPFWAAAIGVSVDAFRRWVPDRAWYFFVAGVIASVVYAPVSALHDPRELGLLPTQAAVSLRAQENDLLVPYATPFLAELGDVKEALALPQGPGEAVLEELDHAEEPIGRVFVAMPGGQQWTVVRLEGPFDKAGALSVAAEAYRTSSHPSELDWWFDLVERGLCEALAKLGPRCPA